MHLDDRSTQRDACQSKNTQLFSDMQEHPENYSDEQLEAMMTDIDCEPDTDAAWLRFEHNTSDKEPAARQWLKIAAMFIGILFITGIGYAAYHLAVGGNAPANEEVKAPTQETRTTESHQQEVQNVVRTFENVELQQILQELSDYYHVSVEFRNEKVRHIRLYTKWDPSAPLKQIIERLNGLEKVNIILKDNQIIAE